MFITDIIDKIRVRFTEKKTKKLLKRYKKAMFPKEKEEKIRNITYNNIFSLPVAEDEKEEKPFGILLFCTVDCFSDRALKDIQTFIGQKLQICVILDDQTFVAVPKKYLRKIAKNHRNAIYILDENGGVKSTLQAALQKLEAPNVLLLTANTGISKYLLFEAEKIPMAEHDICAPVAQAERDFTLCGLSGFFFNREYLMRNVDAMPSRRRFWLSDFLAPRNADTYRYTEQLFQQFLIKKYIIELFACFTHECENALLEGHFEETWEHFLQTARILMTQRDMSKLHTFFLAVSAVYLLCKFDIDDEALKEEISNVFDFGILLDAKRMKFLCSVFMPMLAKPVGRTYDALVIENYGMDDIYNSRFYKNIHELYCVKYLKKKTNFNYYLFNNMLIQMYSTISRIVISSGSLNKQMLSKKSFQLTLWHGLGLLKETVVKKKKFSVGTIICSSQGCEKYYKKHFHATEALGLGSIQTDILHDKDYVEACRTKIRTMYHCPDGQKLVFFAPTFRIGKICQYYNFRMDIDELGEKLADANIKVLAKKHYIFDSVLEKTHQDMSGLKTSQNGMFELDETHTFTELVCACDVFVTDYSSGIFYAAVLDRPLVLYAPDVQEYKKGDNGFIIRYPSDIPATAVLEPDIRKFVDALNNPSDPSSDAYQSFKILHVGNCDGSVNDRVLFYFAEKLENPDASQK